MTGRPGQYNQHIQVCVDAWGACLDSGAEGAALLIDDVVHVFPLLSSLLWAIIGVGAFARYSVASPFVRALTLFSLLVAAGCLLDWYLLTFVSPDAKSFAIALANVRTSLLTLASLVILLASKWISRGHSRYDAILAVPVAGALLLVWTGMTTSVSPAPGGEPVFGREPVRFSLFVAQEVAYYLVAAAMALSLVARRPDLPSRLRRPALLSIGSLVVFVILYLPTNVYTALAQAQGLPLFSSLVFVPALMVAAAFLPRTREELGEILRAVSEVERRVLALYVFYRTGEPLVAVGTARSLPIEAEQLEGVLDIVGNFVETSMRKFRRYDMTSMQFDRLGIVAVRGEWLIEAAVFDGAAYDALRSELRRGLEAFETRHRDQLTTLEDAAQIADVAADDLNALLQPPSPRPRLR